MSADARSITEGLRKYVADYDYASTNEVRRFADRIDARFTAELTAKQDEIAGLQARLDASILPPVDIDGARWTGEDVDKPFAPGGVIAIAFDKDQVLREIVYDWPHEGWWLVDQYDTHYPAEKCHHVAPEPPETIEDILRDADVGPTKTITEDGTSVNLSPVAMRIIKANKRIFAKRGYIAGFRDGAGEGR